MNVHLDDGLCLPYVYAYCFLIIFETFLKLKIYGLLHSLNISLNILISQIFIINFVVCQIDCNQQRINHCIQYFSLKQIKSKSKQKCYRIQFGESYCYLYIHTKLKRSKIVCIPINHYYPLFNPLKYQ